MKVVAEVDVELGLTRLVWIGTAQDVGKALNPQAVQGQIEGGTAQGIGLALMEEIQTRDGLITNASFTDYLIPTALDVPPIVSELVEDPEPDSPYGLKGVGEPPTVVVDCGCRLGAAGRDRSRAGPRSRPPRRAGRPLMAEGLARRIAVARGDEPADLVVRGGRVLSVFTREWLEADVASATATSPGSASYDGSEVLDASGRYVVPGFIDAHMHLESTKLLVDEFARLVLPLGTTAVVADPHEIANVLGTDGVHWLLDVCAGLPLDVYFMASSCVPASAFESPRRAADDRRSPGAAAPPPRDRSRRDDELPRRHRRGRKASSRSSASTWPRTSTDMRPASSARHLNAYAAAGIRSDHEASTLEEGRQRLRAGMWVLIREASVARNLRALVPLVDEFGPHRLAFCTDDREPEHIVEDGHLNAIVRDAVALGVAPEDALVMASLQPGDVARSRPPGCGRARLPGRPPASARSRVVPSRARPQGEVAGRRRSRTSAVPEWVKRSVRIAPVGSNDFHVPWAGGKARVIGLVPGQIITEPLIEELTVVDGLAVADPARDLAKVAVVERHHGTGRIGLGFVHGFGLQRGAFASTVAHDAHNIVVVGVDDGDMARAVQRLAELGGGLVVVESRGVRAELPLPVAGLLAEAPADEVAASSRDCVRALAALGCTIEAPFQALAFLALSVIPALKITDQGLVDVDSFRLVPLAVD